ncbi:MAG: aminotransferase class V-fold PLP-dependent enzyme [Bacteroidetes bacterium]|nr:aminotransferase class V-fold PLP-dependent enzyme [Bacteroidota bacterium]
MNKRNFLKRLGLMSLLAFPGMLNLDELLKANENRPAGDLASDEDFWLAIRQGYQLRPGFINLENGYYCFLPQETLEKFIGHIKEVNLQGSYYMRTVQFDNKKIAAGKVASMLGCPADEVIITRNTTESLDLVIGGFPWKEGDEAVMAEQDYPAMLDMFKMVGRRYGVVSKKVSVPMDPGSDDEVVKVYADAITGKTKLLMVCHMINITGHILPVQKICDMAHSRGVQVMVDGAHAVAHFNYEIPDLHCDYYGSSLHKWLSVPLGAGMLWIKKEHIPTIWPLIAEEGKELGDITRLNHLGTHPVHTDLTIADAIDFYMKVGAERKEERLRYLQTYWTSKVRPLPNIILNTPSDPKRSCGIANVGIKGIKPSEMSDTLFKKYGIYTAAIDGAGVHGCRVVPNIYTTPEELDKLIEALKEMAA